MARTRALYLLLLFAGVARGESRVRLHTEMSLWTGYTWGNQYTPYMDYSQSGVALDARAAFGVGWGSEQHVIIRVGGVIDAFLHQPYGIAGGLEVQGDIPASRCWRVGGRLAFLVGDGDDQPKAGDGQVLVAGLRLRNGNGFVGIDSIFARTGDGVMHGYANGVLIGGGVSGKPGAIALGGTALLTGIIAVIAVASLSRTH